MNNNNTDLVLVIGATSGTGIHVARELSARGQRLRIAARNLEKARALYGADMAAGRIELVEVDLLGEMPAGLFRGVTAVIDTAALPPKPAGEALLRATEVDGLAKLVDAGKREGFRGRFVWLTSMGMKEVGFYTHLLGLFKRGIVRARHDSEAILDASGFDVARIRAGFLTDAPALAEGARAAVSLIPGDAPLARHRKIARADVARVLVECLTSSAKDMSAFTVPGGAPPVRDQLRALAAVEALPA